MLADTLQTTVLYIYRELDMLQIREKRACSLQLHAEKSADHLQVMLLNLLH